MTSKPPSRILWLTLIALVLIAAYMTVNSYYTQVRIYEEKELFKLDCIANAVAYKISGEEHQALVERYPTPELTDSVRADERYRRIRDQMTMAKAMTGVPSSMHTLVKDDEGTRYLKAIGTDSLYWLMELNEQPMSLDTLFGKGGMIGRYRSSSGDMLGAISPVTDSEGRVVGALHVEETFASFLSKARNQVYFNLLLSLLFIVLVGALMFFSLRHLLIRQQRLENERLEIEALRKELVANVSHDLRTPLSGIQGYLETLLMKNSELNEATRREYLESTLKSTSRLRKMADELFELSRLESRERKLQAEPFSLPELASDVSAQLRGQAAARQISIQTDIEPRIPMVMGDVALVDRVLQNLIGNAVHHGREGGKVHVAIRRHSDRVEVSVSDDGPGIAPEELPHVFDRFRRGSSRPGTGLGLAIVRSALQLHGSDCSVESAPGRGATFRFSLTIASL